jgi:hypothetical protein
MSLNHLATELAECPPALDPWSDEREPAKPAEEFPILLHLVTDVFEPGPEFQFLAQFGEEAIYKIPARSRRQPWGTKTPKRMKPP